MQHRMHCATLTTAEKPDEVWEAASLLVTKTIQELLPWVKVSAKEDTRRQLAQGWKATYGDPSDPEVAERIRQTALALVRDANAAIRRSMQ